MKDGEVDATLLALAGLKRLKIADMTMQILQPDIILPAVGQGAIGITCRTEDMASLTKLKTINHTPSWQRIIAERAMLATLDGSCQTPIGGLASINLDGKLSLKGVLANEDGSKMFTTIKEGLAVDAEAIGTDVGKELRRLAGVEFLI